MCAAKTPHVPNEILHEIVDLHCCSATTWSKKQHDRGTIALVSKHWRSLSYANIDAWSHILVHRWTTPSSVEFMIKRAIGDRIRVTLDAELAHDYRYKPRRDVSQGRGMDLMQWAEQVLCYLKPVCGRVQELCMMVLDRADWMYLMRKMEGNNFARLERVSYSMKRNGKIFPPGEAAHLAGEGGLTYMALQSIQPLWSSHAPYARLQDLRMQAKHVDLSWEWMKMVSVAAPLLATLFLREVYCSNMKDAETLELRSLTRLNVVLAHERCADIILRMDAPLLRTLEVMVTDGGSLQKLVAGAKLDSVTECALSMAPEKHHEIGQFLRRFQGIRELDLRVCEMSMYDEVLHLYQQTQRPRLMTKIVLGVRLDEAQVARMLVAAVVPGGTLISRHSTRKELGAFEQWVKVGKELRRTYVSPAGVWLDE
ncbi:hypothetical protein C8R46DRAFT_1024876 [Mycena filopes]|nr:hypothetical protein C8R46DRAFT_1024876 [Mycena filopes]